MISVQLKGLEALRKKINPSILNKIVEEEIELAAFGAKGDAISKCISTSVASSINVEVKPESFVLEATDKIAPYIEFGTGGQVFQTSVFNFTPEMKAYAKRFYVNGEGRTSAHPFLFPAAFDNYKEMVKNVKKRVKELYK
jgi:hypothetical protein